MKGLQVIYGSPSEDYTASWWLKWGKVSMLNMEAGVFQAFNLDTFENENQRSGGSTCNYRELGEGDKVVLEDFNKPKMAQYYL